MSDETVVRFDPHVHSAASHDGTEPVERILQHARDIGLDAIAITDHDTIERSLRAASLAPKYGLIGVPGVEISTRDGHLIGLGIETMPEPNRPFFSTVQAIRDRGGVAVVPHPFQRIRHGVSKGSLTDCDAVEVYNAWLFTGYRNRRARVFARRHCYPALAGSDAHSILTIGRAYTEIAFENAPNIDAQAILEAITDGAVSVHGRRAPFHRSIGHYVRGACRKTATITRTTPAKLLKLL
ncbi:PHP domain-containing protein [Halocatena halophila]|uniref:PHP domain-containing protein n=1 Tax=Halocatena halophila TaxID=2814576 RepID=UPI002ED32E29